ncbi:protein tweety homolog 3 [Pteropus vampyrus]|uniref:Protein tweety homolog n=1 Tax=Pteropus vampyrus TaxID=132908 RepID=A0A6P6CM11_PTEVA|nr:protein tweety homolog 3 [Pteropus vampyrus]
MKESLWCKHVALPGGTLAGSLTMVRAALGVRYLVQARPESGFVPLVEGGRAGPWGERAWWATGSGSDLPELLSAPCWGSALVSLEGEVSVVCACVAMRCESGISGPGDHRHVTQVLGASAVRPGPRGSPSPAPFPGRLQALLLLGAAALACLALDLLFLLFYSFWLCCRRRKSEEHLDADCCCTAWCVIIATLVCSAGIAVGFYGNGETSDGIHRATYSLRHANRTVAGVQDRVWDTAAALNRTAEPSLQSLERQLAARPEPLRAVQRLQSLLDTLLGYAAAIPFWRNPAVSLETLAEQVDLYDWYRWLGYLGLLLLDVAICLLVLVGLIRSSKGILVGVCLLGVLALVISWGALGLELAASVGSSDFCVDPDTYVTRMVDEHSVLSGDILQYYLACSPRASNPFQQKLSGSHKALVEMQDVVAELLQTVPREYPASKDPLLRVQEVLNGTEVNLQHLTALVDCRSLHLDYVQALTGFCYDGVEGLIYLALFSFVTALMFSSIVCSVPHTWQQKRGPDEDGEEEAAPGPRQAHDSLYRVHMPSLYSCGSSYGSETSIPAAAHTVSNGPVTEYMSQNANFQNPRCENTPLIGRESPPPSRYLAALDSGSHTGWQFKPMDSARTRWWLCPQSDRY